MLILGRRLVAVVLTMFRRRLNALKKARLIMFSRGGPCAKLTHSFPLYLSAGCLRVQMEQQFCPAASLPKSKLLPGMRLDPNPAAWIPSIREIKEIVVLALQVTVVPGGNYWDHHLSQPFW